MKIMKKFPLLAYLIGIVITGCTIPERHTVEGSPEYSHLSCIKAKHGSYLQKMYNTCPMFFREPETVPINADWKLRLISDQGGLSKLEHSEYEGKISARNCQWPTVVFVIKKVPKSNEMHVTEVTTWTDFENGFSYELTGKTKDEDGVEQDFYYRVSPGGKSVDEHAESVFEPCHKPSI